MTTVNRNLVQYDIGVKNMAGFLAGAAITSPSGFVEMSATNYTIKHSIASGTTRPMGICTVSGAIGSYNEVRTGGYVWQYAVVSMAAGDPVYPSSTQGKVQKTGKTLSGATLAGARAALFPRGFGTVVYATRTTGSGYILTKLQGLV